MIFVLRMGGLYYVSCDVLQMVLHQATGYVYSEQDVARILLGVVLGRILLYHAF